MQQLRESESERESLFTVICIYRVNKVNATVYQLNGHSASDQWLKSKRIDTCYEIDIQIFRTCNAFD